MKWLKNIWWLLNSAPTVLTVATEEYICDYCGGTKSGITHYTGSNLYICSTCRKRQF